MTNIAIMQMQVVLKQEQYKYKRNNTIIEFIINLLIG
jgi:hypothetical protein